MSQELEREVLGATDHGEVCIITREVNTGVENDIVQTELHYSVRQGSREVVETTDENQARTVAEALCPPAKKLAKKVTVVKAAEPESEAKAEDKAERAKLTA